MKFLRFFYSQLSAQNLPLLLRPPFWKWVRNNLEVVDEKISQFDWPTGDTSSFSTHEGACSWNRLVQQICPWSLLPHIPVWYEGAKLGSKSFVAQHIFWIEIVDADEGALLRERVTGGCCGSKLPCVYRPLWEESLQSPTFTSPPARGSSNALYCNFFIFEANSLIFSLVGAFLLLSRGLASFWCQVCSVLCCCKFTFFVSKFGKRVELVLFLISFNMKLFTA